MKNSNDWILECLDDMLMFAKMNDLFATEAAIAVALNILNQELERSRFAPYLIEGGDNVIEVLFTSKQIRFSKSNQVIQTAQD